MTGKHEKRLDCGCICDYEKRVIIKSCDIHMGWMVGKVNQALRNLGEAILKSARKTFDDV